MVAPAERELDLMQRRRPSVTERIRALAGALFEAKTLRAYRRLFLVPNGETLSADGAIVLADLARAAGLGKVLRGQPTAFDLAEREGRRAELLHVLAKLDRANLDRAAKRLSELQTKKTEEPTDE